MSIEHQFDFVEDEKDYDIERQGSYGRFFTSNSFPIEYILTTLRPEQLEEYLTFAKDVRPEQIDFDLLMQRDIDEDRVRNEIAPYLDPRSSEADGVPSGSSRALFFPPLLVAIAPVEGKKMGRYYEDETCEISADNTRAFRKWGRNLFKITYQVSKSANSPIIETYDSNGEKFSFPARASQVIFEGWKSKGNSPGVRLIVIDGQHRLKALQEVYKRRDGLIDDLLVPICLLYAPKSQHRLESEGVLTIPEVFRQLFVDVNSTAETVGGHFNILLKDNNIGSLICRQFCSSLLEKGDGRQKLAVVEWNTKKFKESTNIVRKYSTTSIGIIEKALRENLKKGAHELEYWLNLNSVQDALYPIEHEKGSFECPVVDWDTFNSRQRKVLAEQVNKYAVPLLYDIYFRATAFASMFEEFQKKLKQLEVKCGDTQKGINVYTPAYEQILDYMQIPIDKSRDNKEALSVVRELGEQVSLAMDEAGLKIIQYALYQRGVFALWFDLLKIGNIFNVQPALVNDILVAVLDEAHSHELRNVFDYKHSYMQHAVFRADNIITIDETRKALKSLLGSFLGLEKTLKIIAGIIRDKGINEKDFLGRLKTYGDQCPADFFKSYEKGYIRDFKKTYTLDETLSASQKDRLAQAEAKQKQHKKEYREKIRAREDVSTEFDNLLDTYVASAVAKASESFKTTLGLALDIIPGSGTDEFDEYEDPIE